MKDLGGDAPLTVAVEKGVAEVRSEVGEDLGLGVTPPG